MNISGPTLSLSELGNRIVGRYPFRPIILELALLYLYAASALAILLCTFSVRDSHVQVTSASGEEGDDDSIQSVSAPELARMKLTSPLTLVAASFVHEHTEANNVELSMRTSELGIFDEKPGEKRLRVGLDTDEQDGMGNAFGAWRKDFPGMRYIV